LVSFKIVHTLPLTNAAGPNRGQEDHDVAASFGFISTRFEHVIVSKELRAQGLGYAVEAALTQRYPAYGCSS